MSTEIVLLVLRLVAGVLLVVLMGAVFLVVWRDYRTAAVIAESTRRQGGRLVVVKAADADVDLGVAVGASFPLQPLTSLGRAPANTVVLADTFCSQEHALVTRRGGQWWLEDRDSSNGTLLNGEPVYEPVVLSSGDEIGVGRVCFRVELA
ncbi:MAG: FHA domain-containing protein [Chloroflexi bacterium]|nr:FHA domain-containing protein [Chloroflexota bacterium]